MKTLLLLYLWAFFLLFPGFSHAQFLRTSNNKYLEGGVGLMAVNYAGDLAEDNIMPAQTRFGTNLFARYHLSQMIHVRGNLGVSFLYGDDKHSPTHVWRCFTFKNTVVDLGAYLELNFARILIEPNRSKKRYYLMIYGLAGPSVVFSRPEATYYGEPDHPNIDPRFPGEGNDPRTYFTWCYGGGIRWLFQSRYSIGLEGTVHPVYDDWLDGVSSYTGDPKDRDWYFKGGLTFTYFLNRDYRPNFGEY
jgi:hypothetical protein